jgi:hypothetical protein
MRLLVCIINTKHRAEPGGMSPAHASKPMNVMQRASLIALSFFACLQMILNRPIEEWPRCDALLVWESQGFPLEKAKQYVRMTKPFLINDVFKQDILRDRRMVYKKLKAHNVPIPPHIVINRTREQCSAQIDPPGFEETDDYVSMVRRHVPC